MKNIILSLFVLLFATTVSFAQDHTFNEATKLQLNILKTELKISDVQYGRIGHTIEPLVLEELKVKKILKDSPDAMKARLDAIKEIKIKNLLGGLSPAQVELFNEKKIADKL